MNTEPKVDLCFQVIGRTIPVDHGFALYSAISRVLPIIHEDTGVGVKLIRGRYVGGGMLDIFPHSDLVIRLTPGSIGKYLALAGKTLQMGGCSVLIGVPNTRALVPGRNLYAQLVTTKNGHDQVRFETEMQNRLQMLDVSSMLEVHKRRTFNVHGKQVVGYTVMLRKLDEASSILIQEEGLGGRRKMGCGFFEAWKD